MTVIQWHADSARTSPCPICADARPKPLLLTIDQLEAQDRDQLSLELLRCNNCGARYYRPCFVAPDKDLEVVRHPAGSIPARIKFYIEQGAGIETMLSPLRLIDGRPISRVVEVGCGFGFLIHYTREILGWDITGFDPGAAAVIGKSLLDLPIENFNFDPTQFAAGSVDLVYASEVIEHIPDPLAFLRGVRRVLSRHGALVLTTPNAEVIEPGMSPELMSVLAPGGHVILYTVSTLQRLLTDAGFEHVRFESSEHQICLCASVVPFSGTSAYFSSDLYRSYLIGAAATQPRHSLLRLGFEYRLLKMMVNGAEYLLARPIYDGLRLLLRDCYGFNPDDLEPAQIPAPGAVSLSQFSKAWPFSLCGILFFHGLIQHLGERDSAAAAKSFRNAAAFGGAMRAVLWDAGAYDLETAQLCREAELALVTALAMSDPAAITATLSDIDRNHLGFDLAVWATHRDRVRRRAFTDLVNLGHIGIAGQILEQCGSFLALPLTETSAPAALAEAKYYAQCGDLRRAQAIYDAARHFGVTEAVAETGMQSKCEAERSPDNGGVLCRWLSRIRRMTSSAF